jgi:hypothetical protein
MWKDFQSMKFAKELWFTSSFRQDNSARISGALAVPVLLDVPLPKFTKILGASVPTCNKSCPEA